MFRSPSPASNVAKAKPRSSFFKNKHQSEEKTQKLENGITMPMPKASSSSKLARPSTVNTSPQISKTKSTSAIKTPKKRPTTALKEDAGTFLENEENSEIQRVLIPIGESNNQLVEDSKLLIEISNSLSENAMTDALSLRSKMDSLKPSNSAIPSARVTGSIGGLQLDTSPGVPGPRIANLYASVDSEMFSAATPLDPDAERDKDGNSAVRLKYLNEIMAKMDHSKRDIFQLVQQIDHETYRMRHNMDIELTTCKKQLETNIIKVVEEIAQYKLPEVYLRSIPKFGGNNVTLSLHKSLVALKRATEAAKGNALTVKFDEETIENLGKIIYAAISESLKHFIMYIQDMNDIILHKSNEMVERKQEFENLVLEFKNENTILIEKLEQIEKELEDKGNEVENYRMEFKEKELQMDILRDQVSRRNDLLDEQRKAFHNELLNLKMQLYQQSTSNTINVANNTTTSQYITGAPTTQVEKPYMPVTDRSEIQNAVRDSQREFEEKMEKHMKEMKDSFVREKRTMMLERKHALEAKDNDISELKRKLKRMEDKLRATEENV
jgi:hypothetical protein